MLAPLGGGVRAVGLRAEPEVAWGRKLGREHCDKSPLPHAKGRRCLSSRLGMGHLMHPERPVMPTLPCQPRQMAGSSQTAPCHGEQWVGSVTLLVKASGRLRVAADH